MEAEAIHDYLAQAGDELSFTAGSILKILFVLGGWYGAMLDGKEGIIPATHVHVRSHPWFFDDCSRHQAEKYLLLKSADGQLMHPDGAFLVRPSGSTPGDFSVSVKSGAMVLHYKILRNNSGKYFLWAFGFNSINELVKYHRTAPASRTTKTVLRDMYKMVAKWDFDAGDSEDLIFNKYDQIIVLARPSEGWWLGKNVLTEKIGLFPVSYMMSEAEKEKYLAEVAKMKN